MLNAFVLCFCLITNGDLWIKCIPILMSEPSCIDDNDDDSDVMSNTFYEVHAIPHDVHAWLIAVYKIIATWPFKKKCIYTNWCECVFFSLLFFWSVLKFKAIAKLFLTNYSYECVTKHTQRHTQTRTHSNTHKHTHSSTARRNTFTKTAHTESYIFPHHSNGAKFFSDEENEEKKNK